MNACERNKEKIELGKEIVGAKLSSLLNTFKTNNLDQKTINKEVEAVRTDLYVKSKK